MVYFIHSYLFNLKISQKNNKISQKNLYFCTQKELEDGKKRIYI